MMRRRGLILLLAGLALAASGCLRFGWDRLSTKVPAAVVATMQPADIAADVRALEGEGHAPRPPFGETERRTLRHLMRRFAQIGLQPAGDEGKYLQAVATIATRVGTAKLQVGSTELAQGKNLLLSARADSTSLHIPSRALVFVGRGVVAPERRRDDYQGLSVVDKVVLVLADFDPARPDTSDWYSHWRYQVAEAKRRGALGVLLMPDSTRSAAEWARWKERFEGFALFRREELASNCRFQAWISHEAGARILEEAGIQVKRARWAAHTHGFRGRVLSPKVEGEVTLEARQSRSFNVVGKIPGRYAEGQSVVYCAPWDGGSANARATAGLLALATAYSALPQQPARTVAFVASTLSTRGNLGAEEFALVAPFDLSGCAGALVLKGEETTAALHDTLVVEGTRDNELGRYLGEAARFDELGVRNRDDDTDWFDSGAVAFARRGVPAALLGTRPSELRMALRAGYRLAQTRGGPRWSPQSCFRFFPRD
jgi:hypothetical protein